jgi:N-acetyl-anhydromuramyl-L-alanine amidase AmpD
MRFSLSDCLKPSFLGFMAFWLGWGLSPSLCKTQIHTSYREPVPVPLPSKMRDWRYIVIHHSGAMVGNEDIIEMGHLQRGMENGMAYHFLIGNGSAGLSDGQVVEGHRWKYQLQGGHSHQDYLNENGIGICLVGNLSRKKPTQKQIESLTDLVLKLQSQFHIADDNIHGHGQFYGEDSDCPGTLFPWNDFWTTLNATYQAQVQSPKSNEQVQAKNTIAVKP